MRDHATLLPTGEAHYGDTSYTSFEYDYAPYIYLSIRKLKKQDRFMELPQTGSLFDILFENVAEIPDSSEHKQTQLALKEKIAQENAGIVLNPNDVVARFMDKRNLKISIPDDQLKTETTGPHLRFSGYDLSVHLTASFQLRGLSLQSPMFKWGQDPCGNGRTIILASATGKKGRVVVDGSVLDLRGAQSKTLDENIWYCF